MDIYQNSQRTIRSAQNSPFIDNNKSLSNQQQHHRTKALIQNLAFNSLSQYPNKFYTITIDERKTKENLASKLVEKTKTSNDQKRLIIEDLEGYPEEKKNFINFKFGKKYYTSQLKNPIFGKNNFETNGVSSFSEKNHSEEKSLKTFVYDNNKEINSICKKKLVKNLYENSLKKAEKSLENNSKKDEFDEINEKKGSDNKLVKYLAKLKKSNFNVNLDALKNKISSKTLDLNHLSKSLNFQKVVNHKFNSNTILECSSNNKKENDGADCKVLGIVEEFWQLKKRIKYLEKEVIETKEKNAKEKMEFKKKFDFMESKLQNFEGVLGVIMGKISNL